MKIHIEINELVLHGFDYHDHRRISLALEQELIRLINQNGLPTKLNQTYEKSNFDCGMFNISQNMTPKAIGVEIAHSVYRTFQQL
jgi:hypothetical protein